jgi:hypothetical protein
MWMKHSVVITIGRSRTRAASTGALRFDTPERSCCGRLSSSRINDRQRR